MAQLAARGSHNPKVVGSTPTGGILLRYMLLWRSWQRFGLMSRGSRVRAPPGAVLFAVGFSTRGWMAEWSKALVLGTSYFDSVGSNPTSVMSYFTNT